MHILASDFFEKDDKYVFKELEVRVVFREFLGFKYVFIVFIETNSMIIYFCT